MRSWLPAVLIAALARPVHADPVKLGPYTLAATPCSFDGPAPSLTHVDGGIAVTPDGAIVMIDTAGILHGYRAKPGKACVLERDRAFGDGGTLSLDVAAADVTSASLTVDRDGTLYPETGTQRLRVRRGVVSAMCGGGDLVSASPQSKRVWRWRTYQQVVHGDASCHGAKPVDLHADGYMGLLHAVGDRAVYWTDSLHSIDDGGRAVELRDPPDGHGFNDTGWGVCGDAVCAAGQHALAAWRANGELIGSVRLAELLHVDVDKSWDAVGFATGGGAAYVLGDQRGGDRDHAVVYRIDGLPR